MQKKSLFILAFLAMGVTVWAQVQVQTITNQFDGSGGLNIGQDGLLYIANFGKSLDNADGTQVWTLDYKNGGQPQLFASGLSGASGNDFDSQGNLFQSNIRTGTVSKITSGGTVSFFASNGISCNVGINIDSDDNLYVCNCCAAYGNTIRKVTASGVSTLFASSIMLNCPNGITRDNNGNLYVSNFGDGRVLKITPTGAVSTLATIPGGSNGHIIYSSVQDVLYVASHGSHKIYKLTLDGTRFDLAGSGIRGNDDGLAAVATFSRPNGLALSVTQDTLFVNSSIPVTDVGGRPLNPSVIRMITGLNSINATNELTDIGINMEVHFDKTTAVLSLYFNEGLPDIATLLVSNNMGQIIDQSSQRINKGQNEMRLSNALPNGIYFVLIRTKEGRSLSGKFLVD